MRSGNPTLNKNTFKNISTDSSNVMTIDGTVNKTIISLLILISASTYTFFSEITSLIFPGLIGGFIFALITIFKKEWAPYTVPIYAVLEGLALGGISLFFNKMYPGIAQQSIFLTFGIFGALLFAYKTKIIRATQNFRLGIFATATDLSAEEFGEGSFDKGFYFAIPLDIFYPNYTQGNISFGLHPLTKDGGAMLSYHNSLYGLLGDTNKASLTKRWKDL